MEDDLHKKIMNNMHAETKKIEQDLDEHEQKISEIKKSQGFFAKIKKLIFGN
ncbi:MAG: hypothetical protein ABIH20_02605 [Candidatus Diapherotrites archaeon]